MESDENQSHAHIYVITDKTLRFYFISYNLVPFSFLFFCFSNKYYFNIVVDWKPIKL